MINFLSEFAKHAFHDASSQKNQEHSFYNHNTKHCHLFFFNTWFYSYWHFGNGSYSSCTTLCSYVILCTMHSLFIYSMVEFLNFYNKFSNISCLWDSLSINVKSFNKKFYNFLILYTRIGIGGDLISEYSSSFLTFITLQETNHCTFNRFITSKNLVKII